MWKCKTIAMNIIMYFIKRHFEMSVKSYNVNLNIDIFVLIIYFKCVSSSSVEKSEIIEFIFNKYAIYENFCITIPSFFFLPYWRKRRTNFIYLARARIAPRQMQYSVGRIHRWINFRRYNAAQGQTPCEIKREMERVSCAVQPKEKKKEREKLFQPSIEVKEDRGNWENRKINEDYGYTTERTLTQHGHNA